MIEVLYTNDWLLSSKLSFRCDIYCRGKYWTEFPGRNRNTERWRDLHILHLQGVKNPGLKPWYAYSYMSSQSPPLCLVRVSFQIYLGPRSDREDKLSHLLLVQGVYLWIMKVTQQFTEAIMTLTWRIIGFSMISHAFCCPVLKSVQLMWNYHKTDFKDLFKRYLIKRWCSCQKWFFHWNKY